MHSMVDEIVGQIESVRRENNELWMNILCIALENAPKETKAVLSKINKNDKQISKLLGKLADE